MSARAGAKRNEKPYTLRAEDVLAQGLTLQETLPQEFATEFLPTKQDLTVTGAGQVHLRIERQGKDDMRVRGAVSIPLSVACASCLKTFALPSETPIDLVLFKSDGKPAVVEETTEAFAEDESFDHSGEDDGAGEYDGKLIEWGAIVREAVLLALPIAPRCRPDCLGLCSVCGGDRNETPCTCASERIDPRWEKLRSIKPSKH